MRKSGPTRLPGAKELGIDLPDRKMAPDLKLANTIGDPILVVILLVLGRYLRQRNQRRLGAIAKRRATSFSEAGIDADAQRGQAYLQWKAELDNEGSRFTK